jgi:hypothetical protein
MKQAQRLKYSNQNQRAIVYLERKHLPAMVNLFRQLFNEAANILRQRGLEALKQMLSKKGIETRTGELILNIYKEVGLYFANKIYNEILDSAKETQKAGSIALNEQWIKNILDYFRMYLINKAVLPITITNKRFINEIITEGEKNGWTIERMAKELEANLRSMAHARLVVRTETAKAAFYGRRLGEVYSEYETTKEWIDAHDFRTRHGHRDVGGTIIDSSAKFQVPVYRGKLIVRVEMLQGPGDPDASAENICNCRCTSACAAKRDQNGRLMRKPSGRVSVILPNNIPNRQTILI